jgi:hypothetical protein
MVAFFIRVGAVLTGLPAFANHAKTPPSARTSELRDSGAVHQISQKGRDGAA